MKFRTIKRCEPCTNGDVWHSMQNIKIEATSIPTSVSNHTKLNSKVKIVNFELEDSQAISLSLEPYFVYILIPPFLFKHFKLKKM